MKSALDFKLIKFAEVASTNDTAQQYATQADGQRLLIWAERQTAGRGRLGRTWQSLDGNLFFSLLLEFPLRNLGTLIMASSLSLVESIRSFSTTVEVSLKWPNDVLLNGAKVSGMLLEKGAGKYMIIGIGVNVRQSPQASTMLYPATSLREAGIDTSAEKFLERYQLYFKQNLPLSAAELRQKWLANAKGVGKKIKICQNGKEQQGIFAGIDENADLILQNGAKQQKILAGDVFYLEEQP